ncbi:hypothetical protein M0Q50_10775 [bacterium]|jgi:hypothetical protein|nr:hypothetical protein [bacterium]
MSKIFIVTVITILGGTWWAIMMYLMYKIAKPTKNNPFKDKKSLNNE